MPSTPRIDAAAERSALVARRAGDGATRPRRPDPQRQRRHALHRPPAGGRRAARRARLRATRCSPPACCTTSSRTARSSVEDVCASASASAVADLVAALTEDESIEPYEERKDEHRGGSRRPAATALAIYAADKLTNVGVLREAYAGEGEAVGDEFEVPLDVKIDVWEADLEMLFARRPELPFVDELADELVRRLRADRSQRPSAPPPSTEPPPQRQQRTRARRSIASAAAPVTTRRRGAEEDVGDQHDRAGHRQRQEAEAGDREAVGEEDELVLLLQVEGEPVVGGGRDQQRRRDRRAEQRREVDAPSRSAVISVKFCWNGTASRKAKRTWTPGSATRSSCSSSPRLRSRRSSSLSSLPDGRSVHARHHRAK